jgi:hypothetical protein
MAFVILVHPFLGGPYGNKEALIPEIQQPEIREGSRQAGGKRHAPAQARHAQKRQGWARWQGKEPGAGHRDWLVGGPEEGRKGARQEGRTAKEGLAEAVLRGLPRLTAAGPRATIPLRPVRRCVPALIDYEILTFK